MTDQLATLSNEYSTLGGSFGVYGSTTHDGVSRTFSVYSGSSKASSDVVSKGGNVELTIPKLENYEFGYQRIVATKGTENVSNRLFLDTAQIGNPIDIPAGIYGQWGHKGQKNSGGMGAMLGLRILSPVDRLDRKKSGNVRVQIGGEVMGHIGGRYFADAGWSWDNGWHAVGRLSLGLVENNVSL